jgi:hypothetical protein
MEKILKKKWSDMLRSPHVPEWDSWETFLAWSRSTGYTPGDMLQRKSYDHPYGPDNCRWIDGRSSSKWVQELMEAARGWNKTVNKIRRAYGLPLFKED